METHKHITRSEEEIDKSKPWGYLDGVAHSEPKTCGVGGLFCLIDKLWYNFKAALGNGTNNFVELRAF